MFWSQPEIKFYNTNITIGTRHVKPHKKIQTNVENPKTAFTLFQNQHLVNKMANPQTTLKEVLYILRSNSYQQTTEIFLTGLVWAGFINTELTRQVTRFDSKELQQS